MKFRGTNNGGTSELCHLLQNVLSLDNPVEVRNGITITPHLLHGISCVTVHRLIMCQLAGSDNQNL